MAMWQWEAHNLLNYHWDRIRRLEEEAGPSGATVEQIDDAIADMDNAADDQADADGFPMQAGDGYDSDWEPRDGEGDDTDDDDDDDDGERGERDVLEAAGAMMGLRYPPLNFDNE